MASAPAHHEATTSVHPMHKGVLVNSGYSTSSRWQRFLAALAASVLTGALFTAVALGLTGDEGWNLFALDGDAAAQAVVRTA
jgi:hypothetical protein